MVAKEPMTDEILTLKIGTGDESHSIGYGSVSDALRDRGIAALFDDGIVESCEIHSGGQRIAGLPSMQWKYLRDALLSNSSTLLRAVGL